MNLSEQALRGLTERQINRFHSKVAKGKPDECWPWQGAIHTNGYGTWSIAVGQGRTTSLRPHRVAYSLAVGAISEGLTVDHLCRNKRCCNPAHLEAVTHLVNMQRVPREVLRQSSGKAASVRPRERADGSVVWQVLFRHEGRQTSKTFESEQAANRWRRLIGQVGIEQALSMLQVNSRPTTPTVREWLTHHLNHATGITDGTRGEYQRLAARSWLPALGEYPVDVVSKDAVRLWVREYGEGHSAKTVANAHGLLSTVLASAVEAGHRPDNPAKGVKLPDGLATQEMVFLTENEFVALLGHIPDRWKPLVITAAGTGLRWGEVTALHWRDVDLDGPEPMIRVVQAFKRDANGTRSLGTPKTRRSRRTVSLPPEVIRVLDPLRDKPDALVFRAERGGKLHHQAWHPRVWAPAVSAFAGDKMSEDGTVVRGHGKRPRFHDLRHSHASWLIARGEPLPDIQRRLGHESIKTTVDTYGHVMPDSHRRLAAAASLALAGAMPEIEG